ncbi:anti-sigma K factor RskA [Polymorphobacter glacialis]|uniref:Regulator of SigK n=1 Tax=Sandarakinorhabdus glacialis TaxID=1614636 RepID=A0A916ZZX6_9SPHN|nr:anti-sigma factor [Polymorphobacter glacialis]GGE18604.1 anti-sigma K factor RskA [Polymorphobacter glacialis]
MSADENLGPYDMFPGVSPDDQLAMDYAIGALGRAERRDTERRLRSDPGFRALVEVWQETLSPLGDDTTPVPPPASVWAAINAELPPRPAIARAPASSGWWNSLALWRGLALAGTAAAVVALATHGETPPALGTPPKILVASLSGENGEPLLSAAYDALRGAVVITPAAREGEARATDKDVQLWVIEGEKPPRSLGIVDITEGNAYAISSQRLEGLQPGATLAISVEPRGGSPTGTPTGPVIATGKLSAI